MKLVSNKLYQKLLKGVFYSKIMENKNVGYILIGVSILIVIIIFMFQATLTSFVDSSCTLAHGEESCPMYDTITTQTYLALGIVGILILVGTVLIFSKKDEKIIVRTKTIEKKKSSQKYDLSDLRSEEKKVFSIVQENRTIFQADLVEKTSFGKAKITRILDRLEGRSLIERKRRGMTNVVVLKE